MSNNNQLIELNKLQKADNGVLISGQKDVDFNYSDGEQTEQLLHQIFTSANDLSSRSAELQSQIIDWPTEYHLSATRSNLLRVLDLKNSMRVLELGCGCGSITRYLGEQMNLSVDAIEGSPVRANLARLRCRELENVNVVNANFNDLTIPEDYYDLVLFVGVTEYAGRFSERETDQQALQDLLAIAHRASKAEGVTLIAIENRVGLKYIMGANEDHYAVPYIGIQNYPDSQGIRTYTKTEWQQQLAESAFDSSVFFYPFPDYKVPTVILDDAAAQDVQRVSESLANIRSRDYATDFSLGDKEAFLWSALASANTLQDHANSFLILIAKQASAVDQLIGQGCYIGHDAEPDYLQLRPSQSTASNVPQQPNTEALQAEVNRLRSYISLINNSRGNRLLSKLRKMFGYATPDENK